MSSLSEIVERDEAADVPVGSSRDTGTIGKAMDVLDAIAAARQAPRFTELLNQMVVPRGTLHRQISHLLAEDLIMLNRDNGYELGPRLLSLAARAWSSNSFRLIAEPHLHQLHDQTGETVHLGVLMGQDVIYLDKVESLNTVRMHSQIGNASPAYCTGVGKAMLAVLEMPRIKGVIKGIEFRKFTSTTLTSAQALEDELEIIRQTGFAFDREEHEDGIHCIAAAIYTSDSRLVAGISITAPVFRIPRKRLAGWSDLIRQTARNIENDIITKLGPRS